MIKKFQFIILIIVVAVLASCSNNDYLNVIPKESNVVVSVDIASIAEKGDLANSDLLKFMYESAPSLSQKDKDKIDEYTKNPGKMGIDLRAPMYIFTTPTNYVGVTMKINDSDDFGEFLDMLRSNGSCSKIVEHEGKKFGTLMDWDFAYNDNTFTLLIPLAASTKAGNRSVLTSLFKQTKENSFISTETFEAMSDYKGEINAFANMKALPQNYYPLQMFGVKGVRPGDIEMYMSATFEDGNAVVSSEIVAKTDAAKKLFDNANKHIHKIEGRYINTLTDNSFMWICMGVEGSELMKNIKENPQAKQFFLLADRAIDVEKILNSVNGDISATVGFVPNYYNTLDIDYIVTANVKDTKFLEDVNYWKTSMKDYGFAMTETGKNQYSISGSDISINWGVDGDNVYFSSGNALQKNAFTKRTETLVPYTDDIKDSYTYIYIDLEHIIDFVGSGLLNGLPILDKRASCLKSFIIRSKEMNKSEMIIELKDKNTNFLKQMF